MRFTKDYGAHHHELDTALYQFSITKFDGDNRTGLTSMDGFATVGEAKSAAASVLNSSGVDGAVCVDIERYQWLEEVSDWGSVNGDQIGMVTDAVHEADEVWDIIYGEWHNGALTWDDES